MPPSIKAKLKAEGKTFTPNRSTDPVWTGPNGDGPNGGISYSLLSRYLVCKERFRLLAMLGLKPNDRFSAPLEFGNMWHVVEEGYGKEGCKNYEKVMEGPFKEHCMKLWTKYPRQRDEIGHWAEVIHNMFPRYFKRWADFPDVKERKVLMPETAFNVSYVLPSGRTVRLRGKWDSVDLIGSGKEAGVYLQENKTKSRIESVQIVRQLSFDLQTMLYLVALREHQNTGVLTNVKIMGQVEGDYPDGFFVIKNGKRTETKMPIRGVRYNIIKRATHKTAGSMMTKLDEDKEDGRIREWFDRYKVEVSDADVDEFKRTCLHPVLENLCDDHEWWLYCNSIKPAKTPGLPACFYANQDEYDYETRAKRFSKHAARHYRHPYGVYNVLDEGGSADLDNYLATGSEVGLMRTKTLFPELANASNG